MDTSTIYETEALPELVMHPDPRLREVCTDVEAIDEDFVQRVSQLVRAMRFFRGVGIAAPQIGWMKRVVVVDRAARQRELVLVNPVIMDRSEATSTWDEGSLSLPGVRAKIRRHKWIVVEDCNARGERVTARFRGDTARIIQHEIDYLDGITLLDRMGPADKALNRHAIGELERKAKNIEPAVAAG